VLPDRLEGLEGVTEDVRQVDIGAEVRHHVTFHG